ncbi:hypothetical protein [Flavilitoribacter nigricans]|uniref:Uncharacterized protein n=1 Tax=Flavilitoribacter nigricans (strain ATCC 23147 / DSM 23189 / NBRC 102662 / NCIMB 1420 / SS-2) TaxID=1122177 RepID=A0A2D0N7G7_FLAN2|nr:hypothetical protein [Flavilitoribacter nigricans]PHN04336.1 hypothetical protein CRP01_22505 [Flavilitoribacter nigricans DSM 23189 = NBRC 102662]
MKVKVKVVVIVEGGVVQNVYCPNPSVAFDYIVVDYDLEDSGIEGMEELVQALERADSEEKKYDSQPSIEDVLAMKRADLVSLRNED